MARRDQRPGRRRAVPERRPRRSARRRDARAARLEARETRRGERRSARKSAARPARERSASRGALTALWLLLVLAALVALLTAWVTLEELTWVPAELPAAVPDWLPRAAAVAVTTLYAFALGVRTGGRPLIAGVLALVLTAAAAVSEVPVLLAGAAVCTAAMGGVLGVLVTVPAARFRGVLRECLVAILVVVVAAFAADAYDAQVSLERADYLALALALVGALVLVFQLGAGVHGLGTRGLVVVVGGLGLLAVALAYTEALARWGSPQMIADVERTFADLRETFGALPRPIEFLLGFPALAWGVSTRARRRQGWWPCAFGAAGLAGVATSLLDHSRPLTEAGLSLAYGAAIGLALGYLVIRVDAFLSGNRGARARRAEVASAHRPEPGRASALL